MSEHPDGVRIQTCSGCGSSWFPDRLLCPRCGTGVFRHEWVETAVVEEVTVRPGEPRAVATVEAHGVRMIARVPLGTRPGMTLALSSDGARDDAAYVPSPAS